MPTLFTILKGTNHREPSRDYNPASLLDQKSLNIILSTSLVSVDLSTKRMIGNYTSMMAQLKQSNVHRLCEKVVVSHMYG